MENKDQRGFRNTDPPQKNIYNKTANRGID